MLMSLHTVGLTYLYPQKFEVFKHNVWYILHIGGRKLESLDS